MIALSNKKQPEREVNGLLLWHGKSWLRAWGLFATLFVCGGCWSESEAPDPLPIPVADPQIAPRPTPPLEAGDFAAVRKFRFFYDVTVTGLQPGTKARIWMPVALDGAQQRVKREQTKLPGEPQETTEAKHGNPLLFTEATADEQGEVPLLVTYLVQRVEALPGAGETASEATTHVLLDDNLGWASQNPEVDALLKQEPAGPQADVAQTVRANYNKLLASSKSHPADEAALLLPFVILCRRDHVPADAEWGFVIGKDAKGNVLHPSGWAKFVVDGHWRMVDLVAANADPQLADHAFGTLSPDRIFLSSGYNLKLQPSPAEGASVGMLVLPYVEVDGKRHEKLKTNFHYEDTDDSFE